MLSRDGIHFEPAEDIQAYSRTLRFQDGTKKTAFHLERPNIMFKNGHPAFICAAYGVEGAPLPPFGNPNFDTMVRTKTLIIPLQMDSDLEG